ncbi:MAG: hypothetical protein ACFFD4_38610, partial [Candidatus Odinarchaeota archaeon]
MVSIKPQSEGRELEKIFTILYIYSNFEKGEVIEVRWEEENDSGGDADISLIKENSVTERIQIKTRPKRTKYWTIESPEVIKGLLQLFKIYRSEATKSDKIYEYTLLLGREILYSDKRGDMLKELEKDKKDRNENLLNNITKDYLLSNFGMEIGDNGDENSITREIISFLKEIKVDSGYSEKIGKRIIKKIPRYEKLISKLSLDHRLQEEDLDILFSSNAKNKGIEDSDEILDRLVAIQQQTAAYTLFYEKSDVLNDLAFIPVNLDEVWTKKQDYLSDISIKRFPVDRNWDNLANPDVWKIPPEKAVEILSSTRILIIHGFHGSGKTVYLLMLARLLNEKGIEEGNLWGRRGIKFIKRGGFSKEEIIEKRNYQNNVLLLDLPLERFDYGKFHETLRETMNTGCLIVLTAQTMESRKLVPPGLGDLAKEISLEKKDGFSREGLESFCKTYLQAIGFPVNENTIKEIINQVLDRTPDRSSVLLSIRENLDRFKEEKIPLTPNMIQVGWKEPIENLVEYTRSSFKEEKEISEFSQWLINLTRYLDILEELGIPACITQELASKISSVFDTSSDRWMEKCNWAEFFEVDYQRYLFYRSEYGDTIRKEFLKKVFRDQKHPDPWRIDRILIQMSGILENPVFLSTHPSCIFDQLVVLITSNASAETIYQAIENLFVNFPNEKNPLRLRMPAMLCGNNLAIIDLVEHYLEKWGIEKDPTKRQKLLNHSILLVDTTDALSINGFVLGCLNAWLHVDNPDRQQVLLDHSRSVVER